MDNCYRASNGQEFYLGDEDGDHKDGWWILETAYSHIKDGQPVLPKELWIDANTFSECKNGIEKRIEEKRQKRLQRAKRIAELKQAFEESGRKQNFADPSELDDLLTLTEKKIVQQCRRTQCHGCRMGWICPKFWSE